MSLLAGTAYVDVLPSTDKFGSALQSKMKGISSSLTSVGKKLTLGLTAPLVAFGTMAVQEASEAQIVARQTAAILKSSGNAAALTAEQIDKVAASIMDYAVVDDDAAKATSNLLLGMLDFTRYGAQADDVLQTMTATIYDMSAQTGKSQSYFVRLMATIQNTPGKALTILTKMGVITEKQAAKFKDMADNGKGAEVSTALLAAASKKYAGQAKAAAGPGQALAVAFGQLKETIGNFLLPFVQKLADYLQSLVTKFQSLSPGTQKFIVIIGVLLAVLGPVLIVLGAIAGAFASIAAAATAAGVSVGVFLGWVLLIVVAIIAVAAAAYLLIKNWDKVKAFFAGVWNSIRNSVTQAFNAVKARVGQAAAWVTQRWHAVIAFFGSIPGKVANAFGRVRDAIVNAFRSAINFVIGAWNRLDFGVSVSIPSWVPVIGGKSFGISDIFPDIPYLAKGGIVRQPTLAMVGEAGPEAVVPLSRLGASSEAKLTITDWRRGIGTLEYELDRLALVRGD